MTTAGETAASSRSTTLPPESLQSEPVVADDSNRTVAIPRSEADSSTCEQDSAPSGPAADSSWLLLDSITLRQLLKETEHLAVMYDHVGDSLVSLAPSRPFTAKAKLAIDRSPTWLRAELEDTFSTLSGGMQDTLSDLILDEEDPYVDEIAWSVAHLSTTDLNHPDFYPSLIVENAKMLYKIDSDVTYAEIVNYGDAVEGGDYYSTIRYKVREDGVINEYEYPRDMYYWYVVHPRGTDELPTYINPAVTNTCSLLCYITDFVAAPPTGRFWREYFYGCDTDENGVIDSPCPTYFNEQCDNDHDGVKDGPCPVLRDLLMDVDVLWEMKKDVVGVENGAIGQVSDWVHRMLGRWGDQDGCRPIYPVVIYYCQDGNCGEYQDMQTAAGRTALIPTIGVDAAPACDHVWNEFYERRWIEWQAEDEQIDHPEGHDGWTGGQAGMKSWRGDGLTWSDSTPKYTAHCELEVTITDANGDPVDGARVVVGSEKATDLCDDHSSAVEVARGLTDETGHVRFFLGDSNVPDCRRYYVKTHTDWADYPSSGWTEVIHEPAGGTVYYWDHQFSEGSIPRLTMDVAPDPAFPDQDRQLEITYSSVEAHGHGSGYLNSMSYREIFQPGDLDFFIADDTNYNLFTGGSAFKAFDISLDSSSGDLSFLPPDTADDWYVVWDNQAVMNFSQVVDATVSLYVDNADPDLDGLGNYEDNCPATYNPAQADEDGDDVGDACDPCPGDSINDPEGDGVCGAVDNCLDTFNPVQADLDGDGVGDLCDLCPSDYDPGQPDGDGDGAGDSCDCQVLDANDREPAEVRPLDATRTGTGVTRLDWSPASGADVYSVSRGNLSALGSGQYGACLAEGLEDLFLEDTEVPAPGEGYFYLVQGQNFDCGLGSLGYTSSETRRDNLDPAACLGQGHTDAHANSDENVFGTVSGSYTDTTASDDAIQSITEELSGGSPSSRYSLLEHRWTVEVTAGSRIELHIEGYRSSSPDGDGFAFEYSTDGGIGWNPISLPELPLADDGTDRIGSLPATLSGPVLFRVLDTDRIAGNQDLDTISIDELFVRSIP